MRGIIFVVGLACAGQAGAQSIEPPVAAGGASTDAAADRAGSSLEMSASPVIGSSLRDESTSTLVDDSEYEANLSTWRSLNRSGGFRAQIKSGVTYSPHYFDDADLESGVYGEIQVGDTYIPIERILRGDFTKALETDNAIRPYARFRYTGVFRNFIGEHTRDDKQGTLGLRYRRVPYTMSKRPDTAGFYFDVLGELNRIWSTDVNESLWNPRFQVSFFGRPLWKNIRLIGKTTIEGQIYDRADVRPNVSRADWRLRITGGVDISDLVSRGLGRDVEVQVLARLQQRWSNLPNGGQLRVYFVPSATLTVPLDKD